MQAQAHVRFATNSDRKSRYATNGHVRFTPESGRVQRKPSCLLRARSGLMQRSKLMLFDHLVSAGDERLRKGEAKRFGGLEI